MIKKTMLTRFRVGFSLVAIPFGVLCFAFSLTNSLHAEDTPSRRAIRAGKVITCAGEPIIDGVILIADGKIEAIGPFGTISIPDGCEVDHHPDSFAMPGLVEAHSHVGGTGDLMRWFIRPIRNFAIGIKSSRTTTNSKSRSLVA